VVEAVLRQMPMTRSSRSVLSPRSRALVGPLGKTYDVLTFLLALAALVGTTLQMMLALVEAKDAHREALIWARAEDELVSEQPRLRRRSARKELTSWRDPDTDRSLAYVDLVLFSWTLLVCASGGATMAAVVKLF
jgi:hypothetical protein